MARNFRKFQQNRLENIFVVEHASPLYDWRLMKTDEILQKLSDVCCRKPFSDATEKS